MPVERASPDRTGSQRCLHKQSRKFTFACRTIKTNKTKRKENSRHNTLSQRPPSPSYSSTHISPPNTACSAITLEPPPCRPTSAVNPSPSPSPAPRHDHTNNDHHQIPSIVPILHQCLDSAPASHPHINLIEPFLILSQDIYYPLPLAQHPGGSH
ncbi:hypothetical protein L208DRAFT_1407095 [Tricholoma matsutake]|nr:hypothetical protein L208DRAFT_1407095 [Tricholoma matsutake 945]